MKETVKYGDMHGGKCTLLISENGKRVIYKPRSAKTENVWAGFLRYLKDAGLEFVPSAVNVLSQGENEHTEAEVLHNPTDFDGLKRYYKRLGSLIFWAYLFSSTDLHAENLIADGEYPVLVDLETLLGAYSKNSTASGLNTSVFGSHLLVQFYGGNDTSGGSGVLSGGKNIPYTESGNANVCDYISDITEGFSLAYSFALAHKSELSKKISEFSDCKFRYIFRPTKVYYGVINRIKDAEDKKAEAEKLFSRAFVGHLDEFSLVIKAESAAAASGDIPLFYMPGNSTDIYCGERVILQSFLKCSPVSLAQNKLSSLCESDREKQIKLILSAYLAKMPEKPEYEDRAQNITEKIKAELENCRIHYLDSSFIRLAPNNGYASFQSVGYGLYHGLCGIMCAYAALYLKSKDTSVLSRLEYFFDDLERNIVNKDFKAPICERSCNLSDGLAGMICALLHIYELIGLSRAYDDALLIAKKLDTVRASAENADLLTGAGGICLALPSLPHSVAYPIALALLPYMLKAPCRVTGAAHGAAGICLALGALTKVIESDEAEQKIISLLNWENSFYSSKEHNWQDLRESERTVYMRGWCSGTPGVLMTRKRLMSYSSNEEIISICKNDIANAKAFFDKERREVRSTLCCGEASQVMAAANLGIDLKNRLDMSLCADSPRLYHAYRTAEPNPSLMQGFAGVAYALLMQGDERSGGMLL